MLENASLSGHFLLVLRNGHLLRRGIGVLRLKLPRKELVGHILLEVGLHHTQTLAVVRDLIPIAGDIGTVAAHVDVRALKYLLVLSRVHRLLELLVLVPSLGGLIDHKICCLFDSAHKGKGLFWVARKERLIRNVQDRAEAAAAKLCELVNAQHLDIGSGAALSLAPLLQLNHLDILQTNASINVTTLDGISDIHADTHGGVVRLGHAKVRGKLVNLDLAKLAHVANTLAFQAAEISRDPGTFKVNYTSEGLVQQRSNRLDWEPTGLTSDGMDHGLSTHVHLTRTNDLGDVRRIIRLQQGYLDPFSSKESLRLSQKDGSMVRRGVPVEQESDFVGRHDAKRGKFTGVGRVYIRYGSGSH